MLHSEHPRMFMEYKADCNKNYNSTYEDEHRYAVWKTSAVATTSLSASSVT